MKKAVFVICALALAAAMATWNLEARLAARAGHVTIERIALPARRQAPVADSHGVLELLTGVQQSG